jgi:hypothetical protein
MIVNKPWILAYLILFQSCSAQVTKINGISFVAANEAIDESHVTPVTNLNANYAALMPFGFIRDLNHPEIQYDTKRQWFGETVEGTRQYARELRKKGIQIMLKPQIWVWRGEFTGFIEMKTPEDWKILEASYSKFILDYAKLGEELKIEIFCIGTELERFVANRPQYWSDLINRIKEVYQGKLTYAANWDEFKRTPFWEDLDYIGIDAYFPVSEERTPSIEACLKGWNVHKNLIESLSDRYDKSVLFTEYGYRSVDFAGKEPWRSDPGMTSVNLKAQSNATEALFEQFWDEDWFAGGFIWKWHHDYERVGGITNNQFTPQNKPVEETIMRYYSYP